MLVAADDARDAAQTILIVILFVVLGGFSLWLVLAFIADFAEGLRNELSNPKGFLFNCVVCLGVPLVLVTLIGTAITGNVAGSAIVGGVIGVIWLVMAIASG